MLQLIIPPFLTRAFRQLPYIKTLIAQDKTIIKGIRILSGINKAAAVGL